MKQEVKRYTVSILGDSYTLLSDESEIDVLQATSRVDAIMKELTEKIPHVSNYDKAILATLNLALRIVALESERENSQISLAKMIDSLEHCSLTV